MNHMRHGSALLLSLLVMANMALLCLIVWRTTIWSFDTAIEKQKALQRRAYMEGIQEYATWLMRRYGTLIEKQLLAEKELAIYFPEWPVEKSEYSAKLMLKKNDTSPMIKAIGIVYKQGKEYGKLQWRISKEGNNMFAHDSLFNA